VALHPTRANALTDAARTELERLAADERVVAIGETGMDLYWPGKLDGCAEPAEQREAFAWHIDLAKRTGKPLMIHNRDADAAVLDVLAAEGAPDTVIFHCFSSGPAMARACVDAGWLLSLSGTVSFRNARDLREAATLIPPEQLLVETDAPFLTPHPFRGAPNESYCLPYTVRALAEVVGRPAADLARETSENAIRTYGFRRRPRIADSRERVLEFLAQAPSSALTSLAAPGGHPARRADVCWRLRGRCPQDRDA
jgi:TatD DNase family protein